jgi:hydroxymethylbilane synthase
VGTSSLRRQAQLKAMRPDLRISPLRGNVDTRIRKMDSGEYDAIMLAAAGVKRLGLEQFVRERISVEQMVPAVGQGALAIEVRADDVEVYNIVRLLNHEATEHSVAAERALLGSLGGGCQVPIAAHARLNAERTLQLEGLVARPDGSEVLRVSESGDVPNVLGTTVAAELLRRGAQQILRDVYESEAPVPRQP